MQITWLGHSGFRIELEEAVLLVDPWLTGNPMFPAEQRENGRQTKKRAAQDGRQPPHAACLRSRFPYDPTLPAHHRP